MTYDWIKISTKAITMGKKPKKPGFFGKKPKKPKKPR